MAITFKFDKQGGFFAADHDLGIIEYAYPTSVHAEEARKNPTRVAEQMVYVEADTLAFYSAQPWWQNRFQYMSAQMLSA